MIKPDWDTYFMNIAFAVSLRSSDKSTKHGCVLIDKNKHIVGTGYNGYAPNLIENGLPSDRPDKYPFFIHAEQNAIYNKIGDAVTAYVTGKPCFNCLYALYSNFIKRVVYANRHGWSRDSEEIKLYCTFFNSIPDNVRFDLVKMDHEYDDGESGVPK